MGSGMRRKGQKSGFFSQVSSGLALGFFLHSFHQAVRAHVCPIGLNPLQTFAAFALRPYLVPAARDLVETRPERVLSFIIDQYQKFSVLIFKRVRHLHVSLNLSQQLPHTPAALTTCSIQTVKVSTRKSISDSSMMKGGAIRI